MIYAWLANKLWGVVIFAIACLSIILLPAVVIQSVRLNGFSLFGWTLSEGYKPQAERLARENERLVVNNLQLSNGLDKCNLGVTSLENARKSFQKAAQDLVDERLRQQQGYAQLISRVNAIKPTDMKCPTVDAIFAAGFGK